METYTIGFFSREEPSLTLEEKKEIRTLIEYFADNHSLVEVLIGTESPLGDKLLGSVTVPCSRDQIRVVRVTDEREAACRCCLGHYDKILFCEPSQEDGALFSSAEAYVIDHSDLLVCYRYEEDDRREAMDTYFRKKGIFVFNFADTATRRSLERYHREIKKYFR